MYHPQNEEADMIYLIVINRRKCVSEGESFCADTVLFVCSTSTGIRINLPTPESPISNSLNKKSLLNGRKIKKLIVRCAKIDETSLEGHWSN